MEGSQFSLSSLLIVTLLALVVPLLVSRLKRFRIPIVVGEIIVGVIVGKSGLHWIRPSEWLDFLQFFGLAYLMFVSGLEIDFHALGGNTGQEKGRLKWLTSPVFFGVFTCGVTFVLSYMLSMWLAGRHMIASPLLFALILTTTSLTVVVPVLKEYHLLTSSFGQLMLAAAVLADFVTMLLISVAASLFKGGFSPSILLVLVLIVVLFVVYFVFRKFSGLHAVFRSLAHGTAQLGIRGALALMIVFLVLAQTLGVQVILGTFLAGILVGLISERERSSMQHKLDAIGFGFVIPIFFIMVGVNFDLRTLFHDPNALLLIPILLAATYLFKGAPALVLRLRYPWRQTLAGAVLLTTQMSVTVAATEVGVQVGAISEGTGTAIILVAMLTAIISPVTFGKLLPPAMFQPRDTVVVLGDTSEAQLLVEHLRQREEQCLHVNTPDAQGGQSPSEDITSIDWETYGVDVSRMKAIVAYSKDDAWNLALAESAAKESVPTVICNVRDTELYQQHRNAKSYFVVHPQLSAVHFIEQCIHFPVSTFLMESPGELQMEEVELGNPVLDRVRLADIPLPASVLVLSVMRDGIQIVPHGDTMFQTGDVLMVVGNQEDLTDFRELVIPARKE